jgi:hypothetical protein
MPRNSVLASAEAGAPAQIKPIKPIKPINRDQRRLNRSKVARALRVQGNNFNCRILTAYLLGWDGVRNHVEIASNSVYARRRLGICLESLWALMQILRLATFCS